MSNRSIARTDKRVRLRRLVVAGSVLLLAAAPD